MNYFEHHIGDYDQATAHLTACEDGIYSRLIRWYMASEAPLPADERLIQRRVRAHSREERTAVTTVLGEFFDLRNDGYHQRRCDEEIARFQDKQAKAKRSAEARWSAQRSQSEGNANASSNAMRTHSEGNAPRARPQTPDTKHQTPEERGEGDGASARASRLPLDWTLPDEWRAWARAERPDLNPDAVADRFRDHWTAKPGKDGRKLDWQATWRNWVRGERQGPGARASSSEPGWVTERRSRIAEAAPYAVARPPATHPPLFDDEVIDADAHPRIA